MAKQTRMLAFLGVALVLLAMLAGTTPALAATSSAIPAATGHTWSLAVGTESSDHAIQGMAFLPREVWINVGDTVMWTTHTADIHTVTFLQPGQGRPMFDPSNAMQSRPYGSMAYDGHSYHNSGILSTMMGMYHTYQLRFDATGTYYYICLVHQRMYGVVHVLPHGRQVPYSQAFYNRQMQQAHQQILGIGSALINQAQRYANPAEVWAGTGTTGGVSVMRFINSTIYIHRGQSITFVNYDPQQPHTVTFGAVSKNPSMVYGNPANYNGSQGLNSGLLDVGDAYRVRFTRAGTYHFECSLHYSMGMTGTVIVS